MPVFRALGRLEVLDGGVPVALGPPKQRLLLAVLMCRVGEQVPVPELVAALWDDPVPASAGDNLRSYVHGLRKVLGVDTVIGRGRPGYGLIADPATVDLVEFADLARQGEHALAAGSIGRARSLLGAALGLWRGRPFADFDDVPALARERARLEERRLIVLERRIEADLRAGAATELIAELVDLVVQQPFHERFRAQLMLALYRGGRQAEALATYRAAQDVLRRDLGIEPGDELRALEKAILRQDPALERQLPAPAELPPTDATFTGRAAELARLDRLREDGSTSLVTVVGAAGTGKTALAVAWAHRAATAFPDGQLYVNLHGFAPVPPASPVDALAGFVRAFGVPNDRVPVDPAELAARFRSLVADRRVLVVLDNAATAEQVRPLLPGGPGCLVLVTSRDRLSGLVARDGAVRVDLDALPVGEAHDLLVRLLARHGLRAGAPPVAALAQACGHLPLALRISAAHLVDAARPDTSDAGVDGLVADLADRLSGDDRLAALDIEGDPQTSVRAAFALSYRSLPADARRMFRLVGLVPGPDLAPAAAAALLDADAGRGAALLHRLATAHLLTQHLPGRYVAHDLIRIYAAELLRAEDPPDERTAARDRLYDHYLASVAAAAEQVYPDRLRLPLPEPVQRRHAVAFADPRAALEWLDAELPGLSAAIAAAAGTGPYPAAFRLADLLRGYLVMYRHSADWLAVSRAGLAAARAGGDLNGQAAAYLSLGDLYRNQNRYDEAMDYYQQALTLLDRTGWLEATAGVLGNMSVALSQSGRLAEAARHLDVALDIDRRTGRPSGYAGRLANLGGIYQDMGELHRALACRQEALAAAREHGASYPQAVVLDNLGVTLHDLGRLDEAMANLTAALALHRANGNRSQEVDTLRCVAAVHCDAGRHDRARAVLDTVLSLAAEIEDRRVEAEARVTLAALEFRAGRYPDATAQYERAVEVARAADVRSAEIGALIGLARTRAASGDAAGGLDAAAAAGALADAHGYRVLAGQALTASALALLAAGRADEALDTAQRAVALHEETGHRLGVGRALLVTGRARHRVGDVVAARAAWERAREIFDEAGTALPESVEVRRLIDTAPVPR